MAIVVELDTNMAMNLVRSDLVKSLGWDGIDAIIDFYSQQDKNVEFDNALFWEWSRYDSAKEACEDKKIEVDNEDFDGEPLDEEELERACYDELTRYHKVIELDNGSYLVQD